MNRRRQVLLKGGLLMGSTLVALVLAEVICRLWLPAPVSMRFQQDVDELQGLSLNEAAKMIENDSDRFWKLKPDVRLANDLWPFFGVVSNGKGLREAHELTYEKPAGELRVLFLGDSCTYGYGVAQDETFVEVAERVLQDAMGDHVECLNAGVPGYTLFQGQRYLMTEGLRYEPDLVVLNFGWNDAGVWDQLSDQEHHQLISAAQPPALLAGSHVCQRLWAAMVPRGKESSKQEKRPRVQPEEFGAMLEELRETLDTKGIPLLVLSWPMRINADPNVPPNARSAYQIEMSKFGNRYPMSSDPEVAGVLDLVPLGRELVSKYGLQAVYYDHGHVTPEAHNAIGETIANHLKPWLLAQ